MRKLAAIMSADVADYTRLMAADEARTLERLQGHLAEVMRPSIGAHHGRIVKLMGDGVLAEFASVVDAIDCAAAIQRAMATREAGLSEDERIAFRIGINLGDVIAEGDDIHGEGVNLADRLQKLAEPGSVIVSAAAVEQAKNKVSVGFQDLGEQALRNLPEPVAAFRLLLGAGDAGRMVDEAFATKSTRWLRRRMIAALIGLAAGGLAAGLVLYVFPGDGREFEPASVEHMAFPLPEQPSIAVLPFDNLSGDPAEDYFADGMTETIIGHLARLPRVFVISRNSTFTYKGKAVKVQQVAEELGVRYVLEGSVQRAGDQLRVTAQLIDALSGKHLWAERYDRAAKDLFALQDEITKKVSTALEVQLTEGEQASIWRARMGNSLEAWELEAQAMQFNRTLTKEATAKARVLRERALALVGEQPDLLTGLAWVHLREARFGWSDDPKASLARAVELTEKAAAADATNPEVYLLRGEVGVIMGKHDEAIANARHAIELAPSMADAYANLSHWLDLAGRPDEAIPIMQRAMRLAPYFPDWYLFELGVQYQLAGKLQDALATYKAVAKRAPEWGGGLPFLGLATVEGQLGRKAAAADALKKLLAIQPEFSLTSYKLLTSSFAPGVCCEQFHAILREAGLPEG